MKFWNKSKEVRERCWHRIYIVPRSAPGRKFVIPNAAFKIVLQRLPGGKFWLDTGSYYGDPNDYGVHIWLEDEKDAVWLALKYSS